MSIKINIHRNRSVHQENIEPYEDSILEDCTYSINKPKISTANQNDLYKLELSTISFIKSFSNEDIPSNFSIERIKTNLDFSPSTNHKKRNDKIQDEIKYNSPDSYKFSKLEFRKKLSSEIIKKNPKFMLNYVDLINRDLNKDLNKIKTNKK